MTDKQIAFVGLGVMGAPMAKHLLEAGSRLTVFNRTKSKTEPLILAGAEYQDLETLGSQTDVIILCVSRSEDVEQCVAQMGPLKPGALLIDHSTIAPAKALELHEAVKAKGARFVDAPVTGGSMGAQKGQLTIFLGGEDADCAEAKTIVQPYAKRAERVGGPASGQMAKMVNQIAVAGSLLSLCESLAFAHKAGLDLTLIRELVASGAGGSWNFENYAPKIINRDWTPGFTVENQIKDLDYCHQAAESLGAQLPATDLANQLLKKMRAQGQGDLTTAALYDLYVSGDLGESSRE